MNERIKQLALQSGAKLCHAYIPHPNGKNHVWTTRLSMDLADMDAEEFAKLIVQECVLEAMDAVHHNNSIRLQLYKHFGVE